MYKIETLLELVGRARRSFQKYLPGTDAHLWPNNVNPTAKVLGGLTHEVMGYADYIAKQKFATTADSESLDLHGEELGLARRPVAPARGFVTIAATAAASVAVAALFRRADGVEFRAIAGGSLLGAGSIDIEVIATTDGLATVTIAGTSLEIINGVTSADEAPLAVVRADGINGGADIEGDASFRARILFRKRNPPHGGSASDYVMWAGEVAGVSVLRDQPTVFVERLWAGPGTVRVFPLMFDLYADGIPQAADVARVKEHVEALRPAGAMVAYQAPVAVPILITISGLSPNTPAVREAVLAELRDTFKRLARVAGIDEEIPGMPFLAYRASFSRSWIWQAVANATGEQRHTIDHPLADQPLEAGQMATLGAVTFL